MRDLYAKMFSLLDARERRLFWILTVVMVAVAAFEVAGISAVLLLLNVLSDPDTIQNNRVLAYAYQTFGFQTAFSFHVALAVGVAVFVLVGLVIKAGGTFLLLRYSTMRGYTISSRLLGAYLNQPYSWFLSRNSSEVGKNVLSEVDGLIGRVLTPVLRVIANLFLVSMILGFLVMVDPMITVMAAVLMGGSYAIIYLRLREKLRQAGENIMNAYTVRFKVAQEATGGIKDVKLLGLEDSYTRLYERAAYNTAKSSSTVQILIDLPRFALEGITFSVLLTMILTLLLRSDGNIVAIVPTLGIFAFSVMRLLPAMQQIYHALATLRSANAILTAITDDYAAALKSAGRANTAAGVVRLDRELALSQLSFRYASASRPALQALDLTIPARTTVGIVGGTGAGKTTLVDVILGLFTPDEGQMTVDGVTIGAENLRAWQRSLGYVPQAIFLTDDTVAANIAFGVPKEQIDMAAVEKAARAAALHDFVVNDLPQGYETEVGERGVRLSGGQRQRIGIARALYRDPSLLIMDEATSALDNITERVVMEAVQNIRADKTIILIAHRLSTVRTCDTIFLMEHGRIVAQGTYDELVAGNETFRKMAVGT